MFFSQTVRVYLADRISRYTTYHALVTIVTNHYRPLEDMEKELDARKALTTALSQLAVVEK